MAGEVFVESFYPEHYAIQDSARQDFEGFFDREVRFRRLMHYPPFAALANVLVRDRKIENAIRWSRQLGEYFAPFEKRGVRALGPAAAPLSQPEERAPFPIPAEVSKPRVPSRRVGRLPGFLREETNSRHRDRAGRRSAQPI